MVLGEHRVGWVSALIIVEDDVLLVLAALNDFGRSSTKLILDLLDDRNDKRRHDRLHARTEQPDRRRQGHPVQRRRPRADLDSSHVRRQFICVLHSAYEGCSVSVR